MQCYLLCSQLAEKNNHVNGIDIDWIIVGVDGVKSRIMSTDDGENYMTLMWELRKILNRVSTHTGVSYLLSVAIGTALKHMPKILWGGWVVDGIT